ncbi:hypothetical protein A1O3_08981, partial [Capronia epimyces CBS 606.96]
DTRSYHTFTLPDSRTPSDATYGSPPSLKAPATIILCCHGFPSSRIEAAFIDFKSKQIPTPLHMISIDRPGVG